MKKILYISLVTILTLNLFSDQSLTLPLENKFLSTENGGDIHAIDAYSDGIGLYTVGVEDKKFSAMNELVFKYGEEAKKSDKTLKEHVLDKGNNKEQELANLLGTNTGGGSVIGELCDDGDLNTENDRYTDTNGTCQGTEVVVRNSVKCENNTIGSEFLVDGVSYLVVDNNTIKSNLSRAETLCTSNVTNMSNLFENATSFNKDISKWDTSNVTNMSKLFQHATSFNKDISKWDTSNVTNMSYMFYNAAAFNQDISKWDTSNVVDMNSMFTNANSFNKDIGSWNTENVTNMYFMFFNTPAFNQNISNWKVEKVTSWANFRLYSLLSLVNTPLRFK